MSGDGSLERRQTELAVVPISAPGSVFKSHCGTVGAAAVVSISLSVFVLPVAAMVGGAVAAGVGGALAGAAAGAGAAVAALNRLSLLGNGRLRKRLARRLGLGDLPGEMVGLCRPENNRIVFDRIDTDDDVGFLTIGDEAVTIATEEGTLRIRRDQVREVGQERVAGFPYLWWIVIETVDDHDVPHRFLLVSREARSVRGMRKATDKLRGRLVEWFADPLIAELGAGEGGQIDSDSPQRRRGSRK